MPRNGFTLTRSSGTRYPECASSIHTTVSTRPGECKVSRSYVSTRGPFRRAAQERSGLALRSDRDIQRITSRLKSAITTLLRRRKRSTAFIVSSKEKRDKFWSLQRKWIQIKSKSVCFLGSILGGLVYAP